MKKAFNGRKDRNKRSGIKKKGLKRGKLFVSLKTEKHKLGLSAPIYAKAL